MKLSFSACYGNYTAAGGTLSVLVSENFSGETAEAVTAATWKDVTVTLQLKYLLEPMVLDQSWVKLT